MENYLFHDIRVYKIKNSIYQSQIQLKDIIFANKRYE